MIRVKRGVVSHKSHKKIIHLAKGYYGARSRTYKSAYQAVIKAGQYSYRDRKQKKRNFRKLWIMKINAEVRKYKLSYSKFMYLLKKIPININRKIIVDIIENNIFFIHKIIEIIKKNNKLKNIKINNF